MKKIQLFLLQFLLISITQHTNAQLPVKTEYIVEMGGTSGKGTYAPMWLTANRQGLSSANTENGYLRAGIAHTMPLNQHFGFSAGLDFWQPPTISPPPSSSNKPMQTSVTDG